jgi:hypothetical protein
VSGTEDDGRRKRVVYFRAEAPGDAEPALSEEHDAFRWVDADGARELLSYGHLTDLVLHTLALLRARRASL